jgi:hypothetical protein
MTAGALGRLHAAALWYASKLGWHVFPCVPGSKRPLTEHGLLAAVNTPEQITALWARDPNANIGVALGPSRLAAVDVDRHRPDEDGFETLAALEAEHGKLPETVEALTAGGGRHVLLRQPPGVELRKAVLGPGLELLATGQYVVVAPSALTNGATYMWELAHRPDEMELAEAPAWLVAFATADTRPYERADFTGSWLLSAFRAAGWVIRAIDDTRTAVRCPWGRAHTTESSASATVLFAPSKGHSLGWFHCSHAHCARRTLDAVRRSLPEYARRAANEEYPATGPRSRHSANGAERANDRDTSHGDRGKEYGRKASSIPTRNVSFIWRPRIARGRLALIEGDPDVGKSLVALDIAARVTTERPMPLCDSADLAASHVIYLTSEDDPADTVVPRLRAAGADLDRVTIVTFEQFPSFPHKTSELRAAIVETGAVLVVIDALSDAIDVKADEFKQKDIRRALAALGALARETSAAVIGIRHWTKGVQANAKHRGGGSIAYTAIARSVWALGHDPTDASGERFVFARVRCAHAPKRDTTSLSYTVTAAPIALDDGGTTYAPHTVWGDTCDVSADDLNAASALRRGWSDDGGKRDQATTWLRNTLSAGARWARDVEADAKRDGVSRATLYRARDEVGVHSERPPEGDKGDVAWSLPESADRLPAGWKAERKKREQRAADALAEALGCQAVRRDSATWILRRAGLTRDHAQLVLDTLDGARWRIDRGRVTLMSATRVETETGSGTKNVDPAGNISSDSRLSLNRTPSETETETCLDLLLPPPARLVDDLDGGDR